MQNEATSGVEGRGAKRARTEQDSSSISGRDGILPAPLLPPPTPEEAAAASREQVALLSPLAQSLFSYQPDNYNCFASCVGTGR